MQQEVLLGMLRSRDGCCIFREERYPGGRQEDFRPGRVLRRGNEYLHGTLMVRVRKDHLEKACAPPHEAGSRRAFIVGRVANLSEYIPDITVKQAAGLLAGAVRAGLWAVPSSGLQG